MKRRQTKQNENRLALATDEISPDAEHLSIAKRWRMIVVIAAATTLLAAVLAFLWPSRYRASAVGVVAPITSSLTPSEAFHGVEALDRRSLVATVAALPTAWPAEKGYDVSTAVLPNTNLVRVDVDARTPLSAASAANERLDRLGSQTTAMFKYYTVTPVTRASPPTAPSSPNRSRIIAAGLVAGLLLGFGVAYALSKFSIALA